MTHLTLTHDGFLDQESRDRHEWGWNGTLDRLSRATVGGTRHGQFHWNELMTRDVAKAKAFYTATLGWRYETMPNPNTSDGQYVLAFSGDSPVPVGGLFDMSGPQFAGLAEAWLPYIAVDDIDARLAKAVATGAMVMKPPFDVPGVGRIAILTEPGGAFVGWMTPAA